MILISRARYDRDMASLRADVEQFRKQRDEARAEREAFRATAKTSAEHFVKADAERRQLIEGGRVGSRPDSPVTDRDRANQLAERLAELQAATENCTCGGAA